MSAVRAWTPPTASPSPPPAVKLYRVPSLGFRLITGTAYLVLLVILLVAIPVAGLEYLRSFGVALPIAIPTEILYGLLISALVATRYVLRPTAAYGPLLMATAVVTIVFLWTLLLQSTYAISVPHTPASLSVDFARIVELLLLVPALALVAGAITTAEDLRNPAERLTFDYPL